ncbi:MAG: metallophosphoesterase family protein [Planctomycetaceae bacterium]|jgi:predicted phosphodiesterase|nr:metallophosphoesterase family protein [Planctomycetaceae bacterium]
MSKEDIVLIVASDIHLSHNPPASRSQEPDWYAVTIRQLVWLRNLQQTHKAPVIIAGDLVHSFNQPAELINMAIQYLPKSIAICGQHDQPYHDQQQITKSAYWTLVSAGCVTHLDKIGNLEIKGVKITLYPFSFGTELLPCEKKSGLNVAVVHRYCWDAGSSYPFAPPEQNVAEQYKYGYDVMVFGDNHCGFVHRKDKQTIINCGTFYRRSISERLYNPFVGLITASGQVIQEFVPVSDDIISDKVTVKEQVLEDASVSDFVTYLSAATINGMDIPNIFAEYMERNKTEETIKTEVNRLLNVTSI